MTAIVVLAGLAAVASAAFLTGATLPLLFLGAAMSQVPEGRPAAYLLVAAAALSSFALERGRVAAVLGLPGGVAAATVIAAGPVTAARVAAAVALVATALLLTIQEDDSEARVHPLVLAGAAWLLLAPTTIRWHGDARLGPYQAGVIRAVAAAALALGAVRVLRWRRSHGQAP